MKLLLLLFLAAPAWGSTRSELRTQTRLLVSDSGTSRQRYSDTQINNLLNEANKIAIARTYCIHKSTTFYLSAGTTYYATKSDFLSVRRLTRENLQLNEMSPAALDGRSRQWAEASGTPTYYFVNFSSRSQIGFSPFPGTSTDTGTIRMDYFALPSDMNADSAAPFDGINEFAPYHYATAYYAAAILSQLDGITASAGAYMSIFEAQIKSMDDKCEDRPNYNPALIGRP